MSDDFAPDEVISVESLGGYGPLTIEIGRDEEDGTYVAVEPETVQFGTGPTRDEALADLAVVLIEYHRYLRENRSELGYILRAHLVFLDERLLTGVHVSSRAV